MHPGEKRGFVIDGLRQLIDGMYQPFIDSVFLIIAIRFFAVNDVWKGLISSSNMMGFLLATPLTAVLHSSRLTRSQILALMTCLAAVFLLVAAVVPEALVYAIAVTLSSVVFNLRQPFFTDLYSEIYTAERRALRVSVGLRLFLVTSLVMGLLYGRLLDADPDMWRWIMLFAVLPLLSSAAVLTRLPDSGISYRSDRALEAMVRPFRDGRFVYIETAWMLVGLGNLCTLPLRAVYLTEVDRGLGFSASAVTLVLVAIPAGVRAAFNPLWARLHHRLSFPTIRIAINMFHIVSLPLFFITDKLWLIAAASAFFGIGTSGSLFIWQLWVTRIAGPGEARLYQAAHATLAGVRGVIAPFMGFALLRWVGFEAAGFIGSALAMLSTLMMLPMLNPKRKF